MSIQDDMKTLGMPFNCPACNSTLEWKGVDLVCVDENCPDVNVKRVAAFIRNCGIENVNESSLKNWNIITFQNLIDWRPARDSKSQCSFYKDLLDMVFTKDQFDLFGNFIFFGAAKKTIDKVLNFYTLDGEKDILKATSKALIFNPTEFPESIGQTTLNNMKNDWFKNVDLLNIIKADARYKPVVKVSNIGSKLQGLSFCCTGTLCSPRKTIEGLIVDNGGTLGSVSKKLSFLIMGTDAGSKEDKAKACGVKIITENDFMEMIK